MTALYYCPAILYGLDYFWLPPWIDFVDHRTQSVDIKSIPQISKAVITSVLANQGSQISMVCNGVEPTARNQEVVIDWFERIWAAFKGRKVKLFYWSDRGWDECALVSINIPYSRDPMIVLRDVSLELVSASSEPSTALQITFTDFDTEYPFAAVVGRPQGSAKEPSEEFPVIEPSQQIMCGAFFGGVEAVTSAGYEKKFRVGGEAGGQWTIHSLQVTSADNSNATGTTTIRASTAAVGGAGSNVDATVASGSTSGSHVSSAITVTTGATIYVFVPTSGAGGHQNVEFRLVLKSLGT